MFTTQINIYIFIIFIYLSFLHHPEEDNDVAIISHKGTVDNNLQGLSTGGRIYFLLHADMPHDFTGHVSRPYST